jgi:hypothetical protein
MKIFGGVGLQEKEILKCVLNLRSFTGSCGYLQDPLAVYCDHIDNINILYKLVNTLPS